MFMSPWSRASPLLVRKKMLEKAGQMPISYDDDSQELSDEELAGFYRVSEGRPETQKRASDRTVRAVDEMKEAACRSDALSCIWHFII